MIPAITSCWLRDDWLPGEPVPQFVELAQTTHLEQHFKFFSFVAGLARVWFGDTLFTGVLIPFVPLLVGWGSCSDRTIAGGDL